MGLPLLVAPPPAAADAAPPPPAVDDFLPALKFREPGSPTELRPLRLPLPKLPL